MLKEKKHFILFFVISTIFTLAANFAHPVTPTLIQELHLHDYMFGIALASMMLTNFLLSPFWGKLNNYVEARKLILICSIGYGLSQLAFACSRTEGQIILARMFAGVFTGGAFVNIMTYIVKMSSEKKRGKYLTIYATISSVASAFGYLVGGMIGEYSVKGAFYAQAVTLCVSGIVFFIVCKDDRKQESKESFTLNKLIKESNPFSAFISCKEFMTYSLALLFGICIFMNFSNTAFDQAFNYYLKAELVKVKKIRL